jgi:hypothetical protein
MSFESLWARLKGQEKNRERSQRERWLDLVTAIADGKEPSAEAVDKTLLATGHTVEDLQKAVDRLTRRREARAALDLARKVPAERSLIDQRLTAGGAAFEATMEAARKKWRELSGPLYARQRELDRIERAGEAAQQLLEGTIDNPDVQAELAELQARLSAANQRLSDAASRAHKAPREAEELRALANSGRYMTHPEDKATLSEKVAALDEEAKSEPALAEAARAECLQLQAQIDALQEKLLQP